MPANFAAMKLPSRTGSGVSPTAGRYRTQAFNARAVASPYVASFGLARAAATRSSRTRRVQPGLVCIRQLLGGAGDCLQGVGSVASGALDCVAGIVGDV